MAKKTKRRKHKKDFGGSRKKRVRSVPQPSRRDPQPSRSNRQPSRSRKKPKNQSALESRDPDKSNYNDEGRYLLKLLDEKRASVLSDTSQVEKLDKAIEFVKAKYSKDFINESKIEAKIKKLASTDAILYKTTYIKELFPGKPVSDHLSSLDNWKEKSQSKTLTKIRENYLIVKTKQQAALDTISNPEFNNYYSNLTTPLYYKILESPTGYDILKEFQNYVEDDTKNSWRQAICNVFVDDLTMILNIQLGIWRHLFNDGHLLMENLSVPQTIETCGKNNAHKLPNSGSSYFCPGCREQIGNNIDGNFVKTDRKSAVDHIDPVKHAYTTYNDIAMCQQLAFTCSRCNGKKSDMSIQEFIHKICNNKKPVYSFDAPTARNLTRTQLERRKEWYITTHTETIQLGVNTFEKILDRAGMLQYTYETVINLKENLIKQALGLVEIVDTLPAIIGLRNVDLATPEELYEMFRTLVIICVGDIELSYEFLHDPSELPTPATSFINMIHNSTPRTYDMRGITIHSLINFFQFMADRPIITITKYDYHKFSIILARFLFHYLRKDERGVIEFDLFKKLCNSIVESNKVSQVRTSPFIGDSATDYSKDLKFEYSPMGQGEGKIKKQKIYKNRTRKIYKKNIT